MTILPGLMAPIVSTGSGSSEPEFLDYQADATIDVSANSTSVAIPTNCDLIVGILHGKNGSSFTISSWTLNSIAYTSTGVSQINSSDNNGFSRVMIVYWLASATGTGTKTATCTANKTLGYFRNYYLFLKNVDTLGEADFDVQQSSVNSVANDFIALQSGALIIPHIAAIHDDDSNASTFSYSNTTGYNLLVTTNDASGNKVHTRVGYYTRAAGGSATLNNTITWTGDTGVSVGITGAVEFY